MKYFSIGQISKQTACKIPTIRFYEQEGLLQPSFRTEGNQRRYQIEHLTRLRFILHSRELGFSLDDIRELIHLSNKETNNHDADEIAARQLKDVERKIIRLNALKAELVTILKDCREGGGITCRVIDVLSDHSLCSSEHSSC